MFVEGEAHLRLAAVRAAGSGVAEMNGARTLIFVPRGDVIRLEARYRSAAELPLLSLLLGLLLLAVALLFAIVSVNAWRSGPRYPFKAITAFIAFAYSVPAAWILNLSLRKRWFICVHQRREDKSSSLPAGTSTDRRSTHSSRMPAPASAIDKAETDEVIGKTQPGPQQLSNPANEQPSNPVTQ